MRENYGLAQEFAIVSAGSRLSRRNWEVYVTGAAMIGMISDGSLIWREKKPLNLSEAALPGDEGKAALAEVIRKARKPKTFKAWMRYFYTYTKERRSVVQACVRPNLEDGSLHFESKRVFWIFSIGNYAADAAAKDRIVQRLRAEMLEPGRVDEQTAVLAMLLESAGLLKRYFSEYERREWKSKLTRLLQEQSETWKQVADIRRAIRELEAAAASSAAAAAAI